MNSVDRFRKNIEIQTFMKIGPVGAALFHADRWTDWRTDVQKNVAKLIVALRNLVNAPKKEKILMKLSFRTAQWTYFLFIIKTAVLILCNKIHSTEHEIALCRWNGKLLNVKSGDIDVV